MSSRSRETSWKLTLPGDRTLHLGGRPLVMGVLNLTPDSFSDGGRWSAPQAAVERALQMVQEGVDLLDLGAESTRPGGGVYGEGAVTVLPSQELDRLMPVLEPLRSLTELPLSIDTRKAAVASATLEAGADLINDVSALGDAEMGPVVARAGVPIILMHSRGRLETMQSEVDYTDLLAEINTELAEALEEARRAGISRQQIVLDPGIGFGKTYEHNLTILRHLEDLHDLGRPLAIGASRKSFLGHITGRQPGDRLAGSLAAAAWSAARGVEILRVHDVAETVDLLNTLSAIESGLEVAS